MHVHVVGKKNTAGREKQTNLNDNETKTVQ